MQAKSIRGRAIQQIPHGEEVPFVEVVDEAVMFVGQLTMPERETLAHRFDVEETDWAVGDALAFWLVNRPSQRRAS